MHNLEKYIKEIKTLNNNFICDTNNNLLVKKNGSYVEIIGDTNAYLYLCNVILDLIFDKNVYLHEALLSASTNKASGELQDNSLNLKLTKI